MTVERMAWVLKHSPTSGTEKIVLIGIANHDGDGGSWPSIKTLATYARVSERSVQAAIANLVRDGHLRVLHQEGGSASTRADRRPNRYVILETDGVTDASPREADGVKQAAPRGDACFADGVKQASPETSFEPPMKPPPPSTITESSPLRLVEGGGGGSDDAADRIEDELLRLVRRLPAVTSDLESFRRVALACLDKGHSVPAIIAKLNHSTIGAHFPGRVIGEELLRLAAAPVPSAARVRPPECRYCVADKKAGDWSGECEHGESPRLGADAP